METILSHDRSSESTFLTTATYCKEDPSLIETNASDNDDTKSGYIRRRAMVKNSKKVPFCTSLCLDIFRCAKLLCPGNQENFSMNRQKI